MNPEELQTEEATGRRCGLLWVSISIRGVIASSGEALGWGAFWPASPGFAEAKGDPRNGQSPSSSTGGWTNPMLVVGGNSLASEAAASATRRQASTT